MTPADWINAMGGGMSAAVIVALGIAVIVLYRRNNDLQDRMLSISREMGAENRDLLAETNAATHASAEIMRRAVMQLEARR